MVSKNKDVLIGIVKFPTICTGLWPRPLTKNPYLTKVIKVCSVLLILNYFMLYIALVAEMLRLIIQGYSIQIVLASFSVVVNATKVAVKVLIYGKNNVLTLFDDVIGRERELWRINDPDIIQVYFRKVRTGRLFSIMLWTATIVVIIGINAAGVYGMAQLVKYNEANNASLEAHFTYQFWFPGNKLEHRHWVFFINGFETLCATMYNITTHMALVTLLMYSASHLQILQYRLKNYIPDDLKEEQMPEMIRQLKGFVKEHQYLIEFTSKVNEKCKNIVMMEYILSSFDAASVTISITRMQLSEILWLCTFLVLLVIQIFCLAWSCNEVNIESQAIADAAFESKWRLLNKEGKQITQIMIHQAQQRPLLMTIGPFGPMTMQSFLMIWKAAYSYLSIMK